MGIMVGSNFPELLTQDLYEWYFEAYDEVPTVYDKIVDVVNATEGDGTKGIEAIGVSKLKEVPDGQEIPLTEPAEGWQWFAKFKTFKDQIAITDDMLSDLNAGKLNQDLMAFAQGWGRGVRITEEEATAAIFNKGTLTAGDLNAFDGSYSGQDDAYPKFIYDGKPFFTPTGNNHLPKLDSSATGWFNLTEVLAFSHTNLQVAYDKMAIDNAIDERGDKIAIQPDVILASPSMKWQIDLELQSTIYPTTNVFYQNINAGLVEPVYWRYLDDTNAWFLGVAKNGIRFYDRMPSKITVYYDEKTDTMYAKIKRRFGIAVVQWRYWYGANQAAS